MANIGEAQPVAHTAVNSGVRDLTVAIVEALSQVRAMDPQELLDEIALNGDCRMDSKEAEVVIVILERLLNRTLARVEDLEPEQMCSIGALRDLIRKRLAS